jgi:biotin carboxylase
MTETLLMVGIGMAGMPFVESARRLGVAVHGVELSERKWGYVDHVSAFTDCRGLIDELWVEAASTAVESARPDGVLAFNDPHMIAAALVQDQLGLPGPSLRAAVASRNKALQRALFAAAEVPQPEYVVAEDLRDARDWAAQRLPVLVKPLSLTGGAGVEQVADLRALDETVQRRSGTGKLLVETELGGPEYSWVAVVVDGTVKISNVSSTETSGAPHFVGLVHSTPAALSPEDRKEIDALALRVLDVLRMRTGVMHLECRMTANGPAVIEVAVRKPGNGLMEHLGLTYGVNWYELLVLAALGRDLGELPAAPRRYAATYRPPLTGGIVSDIKGFDEIRADPLVVDADLVVSPGKLVPTTTSAMELGGYVVMAADTRDQLEDVMARVRRCLQIVTAPSEQTYQAKFTSAGASVYPLF